MSDTYLNVEQVAQLFGVSKSFVHQNWPGWIKYGVRPIRLNGKQKGRLMWKKSQLIDMIEKKWVVK